MGHYGHEDTLSVGILAFVLSLDNFEEAEHLLAISPCTTLLL